MDREGNKHEVTSQDRMEQAEQDKKSEEAEVKRILKELRSTLLFIGVVAVGCIIYYLLTK